MTAGQTSSFELLEKVQPGGCLFYDVVNMGGPSKGRIKVNSKLSIDSVIRIQSAL